MSETNGFHRLELMYNLKQDVDHIVRQLNQQNRLISRMRRFQRYCKDFLEGTNQIGLKRLDLEYTKFDRDYRHLNRVCHKMNRKLYATLIYDQMSNLFVSLTEDCVRINGGGGGCGGQNATVNDNMADEDNVDENYENFGYISYPVAELDSDENSSDVFVGDIKKEDTVFVDVQQSIPINKKVMKGLENVSVVSKKNKSGGRQKMLKCDIEGCQFVTKYNSNLTRHKIKIHKISNRRQLSDPLCHFTSRQLSNLTRPESSSTSKSKGTLTSAKNAITTQPKQTLKQTMYRCNLSADCIYATNCSKNLKQHQWIHSAKQLYCDYDGCDYHTVKPTNLVYHRKKIHNLSHSGFTSKQLTNLTRQSQTSAKKKKKKTSTQTQPKQTSKQQALYRCDLSADCTYVTDCSVRLKQHQWIHTAKQLNCEYCDFHTTQPGSMVQHQRRVHTLFQCDYRECRYVGKRLADLKGHRTKIHKDSEKEHRCSVGGCKFVARKRSDMIRHQTMHIGKSKNNKKSITLSTSKSPRPPTSKYPRTPTSKSPRPPTSDSPRPLTSKYPRPPPSKSPQPPTSKSPRPPNVIRCSYPGCHFSANSHTQLFHHRVVHNPFKCSHRECSYAGKRLTDLKVHQTKMHSGGNQINFYSNLV